VTKRTKINFYCSVISSEDYHEDGDYYCFGPVYSHIEPRTVEWIYGGGFAPEALRPLQNLPEDGVEVSMFTDKDLLSPMVDQVETKYKIALLNECLSIHPFAYEWIKQVEHKFDFIFTYEESLLKRGSKYVSYKPLTAGSALRDKDHKIYDKSKLASIIVSKKGKDVIISDLARGHRLRHLIVDNLIKPKGYDVDLWGRAYKSFETKLDPLKDYYFSLAILNAKHDNYFNDNLTDCFRTGTIPIFWGCNNVGDYFNTDGILSFRTGPELMEILESLSPDLYHDRLDAVRDNFERAKEYTRVDDNFFAVIKKTLNLH
jgi:hypothetical protein